MNELSDDKSSGYRSSPSLHSDDTQPSSPSSGDLFGSMEDVCRKDSENMMNFRNIFSSEDKVLYTQLYLISALRVSSEKLARSAEPGEMFLTSGFRFLGYTNRKVEPNYGIWVSI